MVQIHLPPPKRNVNPQYYTIESGTTIKRIYDPSRHGATATSFRHYGPVSRFDHQKRVNKKAHHNPDRGIIYAGYTLSCCLVEVFGDDGIIDIEAQELATITLNQNLKLLDLRGDGAWNAGTVSAITNDGTRVLTQAWGCYFYENTQIYGQIGGIIFNNAHNSEEAIALFERVKNQITAAKISTQSLKSNSIRKEILLTAKKLGMPVQFS